MPDDYFDRQADRFERRPVRTVIGWGVTLIGVTAVLGLVGGIVFGALNTAGNLARQPGRVLERTFDADNMIAQYEWFRRQYADIGAMAPKIANAQAALAGFEASVGSDRSKWKTSDRQQWDQLNRIVLGLQNQRTQMVADYNGRATMTNRSIFLNPPVVGGPVLPERVE